MEEDSLYLQLHKLSAINSEQTLDNILTTLWKTRKTGLRSPDKSHIQSLLNLPSLPEVDPVLACLRSLIRKCVYENFTSDELLKLFPPDLPLDLQSMIVLLLQRYQSQWKEEVSREQNTLPGTSVSYQVRASVPATFTSLPSSDISAPIWTHQDDPSGQFNRNDLGPSTSNIADNSLLHCAPFSVQHDVGTLDNMAVLPQLRSMTWTMEDRNTTPANRVAIINLKLQDCSKSTSGEMEVKFQLTRDTIEAMLRSLTYISEQLSGVSTTSLGPAQKKQKQ